MRCCIARSDIVLIHAHGDRIECEMMPIVKFMENDQYNTNWPIDLINACNV